MPLVQKINSCLWKILIWLIFFSLFLFFFFFLLKQVMQVIFFENKWKRHILMPQFDKSYKFLRNFIAQSFFGVTTEPKQTHKVSENTKQSNQVMVGLGANRHLESVDRHTQFCPDSSCFSNAFSVFLSFLTNIFFIQDYETLFQSVANS